MKKKRGITREMPREKTKQITTIGGQALIEGILMRGPKKAL